MLLLLIQMLQKVSQSWMCGRACMTSHSLRTQLLRTAARSRHVTVTIVTLRRSRFSLDIRGIKLALLTNNPFVGQGIAIPVHAGRGTTGSGHSLMKLIQAGWLGQNPSSPLMTVGLSRHTKGSSQRRGPCTEARHCLLLCAMALIPSSIRCTTLQIMLSMLSMSGSLGTMTRSMLSVNGTLVSTSCSMPSMSME